MITVEGFLLGCFLITAIYHMFLFIFYKKNYATLYFSLIAFSSSALTIVKVTDWFFKEKFIFLVFIIVPILYLKFTQHMYNEEFENKISKNIFKILYVYMFILSLYVIFIPKTFLFSKIILLQRFNMSVNIMIIIYIFIQLFRAAFKKKSDAKIILLGFLILFSTALLIYIIPNNIFKENNPIGAFSIILIYSLTLSKRYSKAYYECENIVEERTIQLREYNDKLIDIINYDALTRAHSRIYAFDQLKRIFVNFKRKNEVFSLISLDIDYFKSINDTYGHAIGDVVLTEISGLIVDSLQENEILGRIGGEEFIIILPYSSLDYAYEKAENIRIQIEHTIFDKNNNKIKLTCSMGVSTVDKSMENYDSILIKSDNLLYKAKKTGRNKVCK